MSMNSTFCDDIVVDEIVKDSVGYILQAFSNKIDENILTTFEIPFATQMALLKINKLIRIGTAKPDGAALVDGLLERIEPDSEPCPSSIDSWARGTVLTKKVLVEDNSYRNGVPGLGNSTPSVSSFRSSATGRSRGTGGTRSRYGSDKGSSAGHPNSLDKTGQIMELDDDPDGDFGNLGATGMLFDMLQRTKKSKAKGFVTKDAEKGEFDLLQEQMDKAAGEVGGKKFVLDRYGKPVVIGKVKPESLPPFSVPLGMNVKSAPNPAELGEDGIPEEELGGSAAQKKNKPKKYIRVAGSRGVDEDTFKPTVSLATTLSGIEHISRVNPGVTVRSHAAVKAGEKVAEDPHHMSRSVYFSKTASMQSSRADNSTIHSQFSKTLDSPSFVGGIGERSTFSNTSDQHSSNRNSSTNMFMSTTSAKSIEHMPDIDALEGARRIVPPDMEHEVSDEELGLGATISAGKAKRGKLPKKPSVAQKANIDLITGSPENGKPRDRDLPKNMRPVADRKHLPAPPLGHITGHGLSLEKFMEKSLIDAQNESTTQSEWHQQWRNA